MDAKPDSDKKRMTEQAHQNPLLTSLLETG